MTWWVVVLIWISSTDLLSYLNVCGWPNWKIGSTSSLRKLRPNLAGLGTRHQEIIGGKNKHFHRYFEKQRLKNKVMCNLEIKFKNKLFLTQKYILSNCIRSYRLYNDDTPRCMHLMNEIYYFIKSYFLFSLYCTTETNMMLYVNYTLIYKILAKI